MTGDRDPWTPPALAEELALALPDAELHVLPGASHSLPVEQPEALDALVLRFLAERFPPRRRARPAPAGEEPGS